MGTSSAAKPAISRRLRISNDDQRSTDENPTDSVALGPREASVYNYQLDQLIEAIYHAQGLSVPRLPRVSDMQSVRKEAERADLMIQVV